ncbi:hypothetical protein CPA56_05775 [Bombella sp. TMW2.1889]|uniref:Uncharacterized protein n=1 Tax=Bombella mellum TaxID=2039288 RepID=A0ABR5ZT37_9PROT|nr:hypothetical protein [Bombella mellum]
MIGVIAETAHGAVFQQQGHVGEQAARFLAGYHEAAGLVGMGVQMLPVVLAGRWPFPGTGELGEEKRCLVGLNDGSGNNSVYDSVLRCHPAISRNVDETVISFISVDMFQKFPMAEALNVGRLAACFDLAAWFVDALPGKASRGRYELTKWEVKALFLGVWVNILVTWLYGMDVLSHQTLHRMRLAICGIVMEKLALLKLGRRLHGSTTPLPVAHVVDVYMGLYPGIMGRVSRMLACCPEDYILQPSDYPETLCRDVLDKSLNFFQSGQ